MSDELYRLSARRAVELLRRREISPLELIDAAERRIAQVEPKLNALPIRCFDRVRACARNLMRNGAAEPAGGFLHGLPIVVKDLTAIAGVRWTEGSRVFADRIAKRSDILVERLPPAASSLAHRMLCQPPGLRGIALRRFGGKAEIRLARPE